jgi:hypothetical protein
MHSWFDSGGFFPSSYIPEVHKLTWRYSAAELNFAFYACQVKTEKACN